MPKIRTLFIYVNSLKIPYIDLGIASLSAYLKDKIFQTQLIDLTFNPNLKKALCTLKEYNPDIVSFTFRSGEFEEAVRIARFFRKNHHALYIAGGIHATVCPEEVIAYDCFDAIGIGEGELALYELVNRLENNRDYYDIKGFWFRHNSKIIKNSLNKLVPNLDELPLIDYDIFDMDMYINVRCGQLDYVSARGCPFVCTYCVNYKLMELYRGLGAYSRRKSAKKIISELKIIKEKYKKVRSLKIADEHFILDKERLKELADTYSKEIGLPFECDVRADFCDKETIILLKKMGCDKLNIAIETGDVELRSKFLHKKISDAQLWNAFGLARKYKIHTMSFNMIGLPLETREQIQKTIDLNKLVKPDSIQVSIFTPFKGTQLYDFCKEKGLLLSENIEASYYVVGKNLKNPNISKNELKKIYRAFTYNCYKDRSMFKAYVLFLRDFSMPYFVRYVRYMPVFMKRIIFFIFWNLRIFKFASK